MLRPDDRTAHDEQGRAEKNKSVEPKDMKAADEILPTAMPWAPVPYTLESWQPDQRMVFQAQSDWWGKMDNNVTEIVYTHQVRCDAHRGLVVGEVDMVLDPRPRDLGAACVPARI